MQYFYIGYASVFTDKSFVGWLCLAPYSLCNSRIFDVSGKILHQTGYSSGEFRHYFRYFECCTWFCVCCVGIRIFFFGPYATTTTSSRSAVLFLFPFLKENLDLVAWTLQELRTALRWAGSVAPRPPGGVHDGGCRCLLRQSTSRLTRWNSRNSAASRVSWDVAKQFQAKNAVHRIGWDH